MIPGTLYDWQQVLPDVVWGAQHQGLTPECRKFPSLLACTTDILSKAGRLRLLLHSPH